MVAQNGYVVNAMIDVIRWMIFALAFDLVTGLVGAVSLGTPVFLGMGEYVSALVAPKLKLGFVGSMILASLVMAVVAWLSGLAFFRTRRVTFAVGTLGAGTIAFLIANNAVPLTGGALCVIGVPNPVLEIPRLLEPVVISSPTQFFYLFLPLLIIAILVYYLFSTSRLGRVFTALREDELRASAVGIFPLKYKLLAFCASAAIIGALGSLQAQYISVVCPTDMSSDLTTTLLIMVFVGGSGNIYGVLLGAGIFSLLPRLLEAGGANSIPPSLQEIVYGVILVLMMLFRPDGLIGLISGGQRRLIKDNLRKGLHRGNPT